MQPAKKTSEFADQVRATLPGHRRLVTLRDWPFAENAEDLIAALVVKCAEIAIRDVLLKLIALIDFRLAVVGHMTVNVQVFIANVFLVARQSLVKHLTRRLGLPR